MEVIIANKADGNITVSDDGKSDELTLTINSKSQKDLFMLRLTKKEMDELFDAFNFLHSKKKK